MKVRSVNIQVNTDKGEQPDFVLISPTAFDILEALQLTHRAVQVVGEKPTSTTVIITWEHEVATPQFRPVSSELMPANRLDPVPPLSADEVPMFLREGRKPD